MFSEVSASELMAMGVALFCFFGAQLVAVWVWLRKEKKDRERYEANRRREQFEEMKAVIDKDIDHVSQDVGKVSQEVDNLRQAIDQSDHRHKQGREQMHGHLRRIEESRPTRQEMEKELNQMKDTILAVKQDLQNEIRNGFDGIGKRFDEFKDYARDLWGPK